MGSIKDALLALNRELDDFEWFDGAEIEVSGRRIIVFTADMTSWATDHIPDFIGGYQVLLAFSAYRNSAEKYGAITWNRLGESTRFN